MTQLKHVGYNKATGQHAAVVFYKGEGEGSGETHVLEIQSRAEQQIMKSAITFPGYGFPVTVDAGSKEGFFTAGTFYVNATSYNCTVTIPSKADIFKVASSIEGNCPYLFGHYENDKGAWHLVIESKDVGANNAFTIDDPNHVLDMAKLMMVQEAIDANLVLDGQKITRDSSTIVDAAVDLDLYLLRVEQPIDGPIEFTL